MAPTRLVFFNPASGSAWIGGRTMRAVARLAAVPGTEAYATVPGGIARQVREHLTPVVTRVYAIGGDGTIGDVAAALVDTGIPLGIVPCGTTNVLAREFGIPLLTGSATRVLEATTRTVRVPVWRAGDHVALLGAGVGWDARVMWVIPSGMKRRLGRAGVVLVGLREMARYEFPTLRVEGTDASGATVEARGTSILLATVKRWGGGNPGIHTADPTDELLDVVVVERASLPHLMAFWSLMLLPFGRPLRLPGVRLLRLRRATVTSEAGHEVEAHVNGEGGIARTPFSLEPAGAVQVVVP
jgi:diacylglycerol kinase (ATP)